MQKKRGILYIFDLHNTQEQYARCLEFITILQGRSSIIEKQDQMDKIREIVDKINIRGIRVPDCAKNYYEEPLKLNETVTVPYSSRARKLQPGSIQKSILEEPPSSMQFHIRIHLDKTDRPQIQYLANLNYLAILLQRIDSILQPEGEQADKLSGNGLKRRVSVFITPRSAPNYPFRDSMGKVDLDTYQTVSSFLRLLTKEYTGNIYGVVQRKDAVVVRALDFQRAPRLTDYSPLIPLNEETYPKLFDETVTPEHIDKLFSLRKKGRFPGANDADPHQALGPFLAETAYYQMKSTLEQTGGDNAGALKLIRDEIRALTAAGSICRLAFVILLFTLRVKDQDKAAVQTAVRQGMEFANELSAGLRQLAQNTLQHSVCHEGVFSFYLDRTEVDMGLRIFLLDFNDQQTFMDNFIANLNWEAGYTGNVERKEQYAELARHREKITLGHFFGIYDAQGPDVAWVKFRQADPSAHIGLLLFSLTMQRCGGCLMLINSKGYLIQATNYFFHCYGKTYKEPWVDSPAVGEHGIPGTQMILTVPVGTVEELRPTGGLGQLSSAQPIQETYESFALYLDCQPKEVPLSVDEFQSALLEDARCQTKSTERVLVADAAAKFESVFRWEQYWVRDSVLAQGVVGNQIYYFDMASLPAHYIRSADNIELFIKGFINAADILCKNKVPLLFAFTNVSALFLQSLRQITISLAPKKFPSGLQLYIISSDLEVSIHLLGDTFCQAVVNAYTLSLEHGTQAYSIDEIKRAQDLLSRTVGDAAPQEERDQNRVHTFMPVCPFDTILNDPVGGTHSLFDEQIRRLAKRPLDMSPAGYKLKNIHMRLGSKVHIRAFYEMAFLFYRTSIANRIAFEILRRLSEPGDFTDDKPIDLLQDNLLFYGYASYSKAMLTSILEILKAYRIRWLKKQSAGSDVEKAIRQIPEHLAFVSYQHNLQSDFQMEDTELYFNFYNSALGERLDKSKVCFHKPVKIVQIVPISSTLTTFSKMETRLQAEIEHEGVGDKSKTVARYTVFWVTDQRADSEEWPREETEAKYWKQVIPANRQILLRSKIGQTSAASITYFIRSRVIWEDPLQCELCYPENVIAEVPLVETDQTSTVPTQQLRGQASSQYIFRKDHTQNDLRLIQLRSCVSYGHIRREKNHFQFYLETQNYFNRVSKDVQKWLENLRDRDNTAEAASYAVLNIIFSPEHATNVGFAQYVNNYYFGGNAEIVCVNEGKEFRSNFKCEHMALIKMVGELLRNTPSGGESPVRFYFVDDTIITGETFHKAVGFLKSLIPAEYQDKFPTNLIQKCFLLVDRLSVDSKRIYVKDIERDFLSFLHIDLSNMRVQGDSCVGCKLEINAKKLLKRSATQSIANYWLDKMVRHTVRGYSRYPVVQEQVSRDKAFHKLVLSHITQNVLFYDNQHFELGNIYDSFLTILAKILGEAPVPGVSFEYDLLIEELRRGGVLELIKDFLKLISRPFFSFDFKVRLQSLTLLLMFGEFLIDGETFHVETLDQCVSLKESPYKAFLFVNDRIPKSFQLFQVVKDTYLQDRSDCITFFQDCLMDGLVELRSTYMMRKITMAKLFRFLLVDGPDKKPQEHALARRFWKEYAAGVHQILDCNNDETRALWLEYLLVSGEECGQFHQIHSTGAAEATFEPRYLFETLTADCPIGRDSAFGHFCDELFLQNNRVQFDGLESSLSEQTSENGQSMEYWRRGRSLDCFCTVCRAEHPSQAEQDLFAALKAPDAGSGQFQVAERYEKLLGYIVNTATEKYGFKGVDIALITCLVDDRKSGNKTPEISHLDFVSDTLCSTSDLNFNKYEIKQKLVQALNDTAGLHSYGYQIHRQAENAPAYFFIYFERKDNPIVPVYLYFSSSEPGRYGDFNLLLLLRDILSYRNRLLRILRNDFAGDIFPKYAHTSGEKSILAHEKATSHNTTGDDSVILDFFMDPKSASKYKVLDSDQVLKWLLLHNYTNAQIAKLFNKSYRAAEDDGDASNFRLYLDPVKPEQMKTLTLFERPLRKFSDLRLLEDGRFALLDTVVSLDFSKITVVEFLENGEGKFYNVEYFKNILIDIIITAMKYATASAAYLARVDKYLAGANQLRHRELLTPEKRTWLEKGQCTIECYAENAEDDPDAVFRYLVIRNNVNKLAHSLFDWKTHNQSIRARLENPIDYADGHMSLLAISRYIEGLWPSKLQRKTTFEYVEKDGELSFETKLPILRKG